MKTSVVYKPCDWCSRGGVKGDGGGVFMDVDFDSSDLSYRGIPVCGGCGGLGVQFNTRDFKRRCRRIGDLRFKYHPIDNLPLDPPDIIIYTNLKKLLEEIRALTEKYGFGLPNSYARTLLNDRSFKEALRLLKENADEKVRSIREAARKPTKAEEESRQAVIHLYKGDIKEGERLFREAIKKFPDNSILRHDCGILTIEFRRDLKKALPHLKASTRLEPKKSLHFFQTAKTLLLLGRKNEAIEYFKKTQKQPDYKEFCEQEGGDVGKMLAGYYGIQVSYN